MVTDAVPDRVLKSGHQPFHTPDLFLVPLDGEMLLKEGDVGIIPRQADPDGSVFQIGIFQKPVRAVLVAVGPDGNDQCQKQSGTLSLPLPWMRFPDGRSPVCAPVPFSAGPFSHPAVSLSPLQLGSLDSGSI